MAVVRGFLRLSTWLTSRVMAFSAFFAVSGPGGIDLVRGAPRWVVLKPTQAARDVDSPGSAGITALGVAS